MPRPCAELDVLLEAYASAGEEVNRLVALRRKLGDELLAAPHELWLELRRNLDLLDEQVEAAFRASEAASAAVDAVLEDPTYWMEGPEEPRWFEPERLQKMLEYNSPRSRAAFAAACAERLAPAYTKYCDATDRGNAAVLDGILQLIWDHVRGQPGDKRDLNAAIEVCVSLMSDGGSEWMPYAADATSACIHALRTLISEDPVDAVNAARCSYASVLRHVIDVGGVSSRDAAREPLVQAEVSRQFRDLYEELAPAELDDETIDRLRELARTEGLTLLGHG